MHVRAPCFLRRRSVLRGGVQKIANGDIYLNPEADWCLARAQEAEITVCFSWYKRRKWGEKRVCVGEREREKKTETERETEWELARAIIHG